MTKDLENFALLLQRGEPVHLAWFTLRSRGNNHTLDEISERYPLLEVKSFSDGVLYRIQAMGGP